MLTTCDEDLRGLGRGGILMKCSSRSMDAFITYRVQLIRMSRYWIFGPEPAGQEGGKEFLSQTIKGTAICSACDYHSQVEELWCGEGRSITQCRHLQQKCKNNWAEFTSAD